MANNVFLHPIVEGFGFLFTLNIYSLPEVDAGEDITVPNYDNIFLSATASNYTGILWETNGDGEFTSPQELTTQYIPGENDMVAGNTLISVTASSDQGCTTSVTDELYIYYPDATIVNAGEDFSICNGDDIVLNGMAINYQSVEWSTAGDGFFQDSLSLSTTYTPGSNDIAAGQVIFTLTAIPSEGGDTVSDEVMVTFIYDASVNASSDQEVLCEDQTVQLTATAENYSSVQWTSNGDGLFSDDQILNPVYTPGTADIQNGNVTLTVTVESLQPCTFSDSDMVSVSIQKNPVIDAGQDEAICENAVLSLTAEAQNYSGTFWETNGDGYFDDGQSLETKESFLW